MKNAKMIHWADDYKRIADAIRYIDGNFTTQPTLDNIAASVHLSKYHFQRLFKRWAGITPTQFMQFLTLDFAKRKLRESRNILDTTYDAGLSGPSRLHDLFVTFDAMTPGEYKKKGRNLTISYGIHPTPYGHCLIAITERGICHLSFQEDASPAQAENILRRTWPLGFVVHDQSGTESMVSRIFTPASPDNGKPFHLLLKGTNFQINVWRALLTIPPSYVSSYGHLAARLGCPQATRAVSGAIAANPIGYLIPCHRVIAATGAFHHYQWGDVRKKAILGREMAIHAK